MDRLISLAAVYEKNFSRPCSSSDVNKETLGSVQNRKEKWAVSTDSSRPELRGSEGAGKTLLPLESANMKNEKTMSSFTRPTWSEASHESCDVEYEVSGLPVTPGNYWERAAGNWLVDSYKKEGAQKSAENNFQEDMHEETAGVSDEEWRRMACMYGPIDLKAEMQEREEQFSQDYRNAMSSGDVKGFLEKYPGTDPHLFVPV